MKKTILSLIVMVFSLSLFCQVSEQDSSKKDYKNMIGIDATGLIQQFLSMNTYSYGYYPYYISYRRLFNKNAIRLNIGGNFSDVKTLEDDTLNNTNKTNSLIVGLGYERNSILTKRWGFYFGTDAKLIYSQRNRYSLYSNGTSGVTYSESYEYGASPFFGIVFNINSRISLSTEMSYDFLILQSKSIETSTPESSYDDDLISNGYNTQFNPPTTINFRILF